MIHVSLGTAGYPSPRIVADLPTRGKSKELFALFPECREVSAFCPFSSRKLRKKEQSQKLEAKKLVHS